MKHRHRSPIKQIVHQIGETRITTVFAFILFVLLILFWIFCVEPALRAGME